MFTYVKFTGKRWFRYYNNETLVKSQSKSGWVMG